jgi:hypothetical protein
MTRARLAPCPLEVVLWIAMVVAAGGMAEAAPPGAANLVAPAGVIPGGSVTFTWGAVEGATFYYLQVNDTTASPRLTLWYPAGQACAAGSATCFVTVTTGFATGSATWWIQTWNPDGPGPWSTGLGFDLTYVPGAWSHSLPAASRFQLVLAGAGVLDRETGLVWERTPASTFATWTAAMHGCRSRLVGGRKGWRMPLQEELESLADPTRSSPALPAGHPFANISTGIEYWSASTVESNAALAYVTGFAIAIGLNGVSSKSDPHPLWCVRGGFGADNPR